MENSRINVLMTAENYIDSLRNGIMTAVEYYQCGEERKGSNLVTQICDGIDWLVKALTLCNDLVNTERAISKLGEKLSEIVEAFENEDYILIGDLLEYEVIAILDEIQNNIKDI